MIPHVCMHAGLPVKVVIELFHDTSVGPKIKDLEAKTLALRRRALSTPSVMAHSRYQCPHPMLRDLFIADPVMQRAFGDHLPPLRDMGTCPRHFHRIESAETMIGIAVRPDILSYCQSNRDVHLAFGDAQDKWVSAEELPESLQCDDQVAVWLSEDRIRVGKVRYVSL